MAMSGRPAVVDPRTFDLRAFLSAVQNIRERLRLLDSAVNDLQSATAGSSLAAQVISLQQQLISLQTRISAVESSLGANETVDLIVDEAVGIGMPVVPSLNGQCRLADPTDPTAIYAVIGLTKKAAAAGQSVTIVRRGALTLDGAALSPGYAVYAGADGELLQHPTYGAVALPVGVAIGAAAVWVRPGAPSLLMAGFDLEHERFLPASVELVTEALDFLAEFNALPDGLMVKVGGTLQGRGLVEGAQIWIDNADGVTGNPVIRYVAAGLVRTLDRMRVTDACTAVLGP